MDYSFDTSGFENPWNKLYPPDVFPRIWQLLEELATTKRLLAVDEVLVELEKQDDDLHQWAKQHPDLFVPLDTQIQTAGATILNSFPTLTDPNKGRGGADPFVIGLAQVRGLAVVCYENSKPTKPRIPDACAALGISCIRLVDLLRAEGWKG